MPRFAFYSHSTGPLHVVAATKKAAVPLLHKLWSEKTDKSEKAEFDPEKIRMIGEKKFKWGPRPQCCKKARLKKNDRRQPLIQLSTDYFHEDAKRPEKPPYWAFNGYRIKYCPFCRARLPKVERNPKPPVPTFRTKDGNYCDTCGERNHCCECNPPSNNYQIVERKPKALSKEGGQ